VDVIENPARLVRRDHAQVKLATRTVDADGRRAWRLGRLWKRAEALQAPRADLLNSQPGRLGLEPGDDLFIQRERRGGNRSGIEGGGIDVDRRHRGSVR